MWNKELNWIKLNCLYCSVIDHRWRPNALIRGDCVSDVFTTFSWRLLRSITEQTEQTHGNMESICFIRIPCECLVLNNEPKRKKTDKHTCLERLEFSMICTSLDFFESQTLVLFSDFSVFLYLTCKQFLWNVFQRLHSLKAELWRKHLAKQQVSRSNDTRWQLLWSFLAV